MTHEYSLDSYLICVVILIWIQCVCLSLMKLNQKDFLFLSMEVIFYILCLILLLLSFVLNLDFQNFIFFFRFWKNGNRVTHELIKSRVPFDENLMFSKFLASGTWGSSDFKSLLLPGCLASSSRVGQPVSDLRVTLTTYFVGLVVPLFPPL